MVDGKEAAVGPGDTLFIRHGAAHAFSNTSGAPARTLAILTPGVVGPEYFRKLAALVAAGPPDREAMRAVMLKHGLVPAGA